jgi:hypothetical protein
VDTHDFGFGGGGADIRREKNEEQG